MYGFSGFDMAQTSSTRKRGPCYSGRVAGRAVRLAAPTWSTVGASPDPPSADGPPSKHELSVAGCQRSALQAAEIHSLKRRVAAIETSLLSTELVLRGLADAHAAGDIESYVRSLLAESAASKPISASSAGSLPQLVVLAARGACRSDPTAPSAPAARPRTQVCVGVLEPGSSWPLRTAPPWVPGATRSMGPATPDRRWVPRSPRHWATAREPESTRSMGPTTGWRWVARSPSRWAEWCRTGCNFGLARTALPRKHRTA